MSCESWNGAIMKQAIKRDIKVARNTGDKKKAGRSIYGLKLKTKCNLWYRIASIFSNVSALTYTIYRYFACLNSKQIVSFRMYLLDCICFHVSTWFVSLCLYLEYIKIIRNYILRLGCDSSSLSLPSSPFDISCKLFCYLMPTDKLFPTGSQRVNCPAQPIGNYY